MGSAAQRAAPPFGDLKCSGEMNSPCAAALARVAAQDISWYNRLVPLWRGETEESWWNTMRRVLIWFLAALFALAAVGAIVTMFAAYRGPQSIVASVAFAAIFLFVARHFAVLALRWRRFLGPAQRLQAAADMSAVTELPVVDKPVKLTLQPGAVCYFQAEAKFLPDGDQGTWMTRAPSFAGWFSITNQRIAMGGLKAFTVPIDDVRGVVSYRDWSGIYLRAAKATLLLTMNEAYRIPRILELMGISSAPTSQPESDDGDEAEDEDEAEYEDEPEAEYEDGDGSGDAQEAAPPEAGPDTIQK